MALIPNVVDFNKISMDEDLELAVLDLDADTC